MISGNSLAASLLPPSRPIIVSLKRNSRQQGYTYLALLFFVAIMGIVMAVQGSLYSFARQRDKETELLFAGRQLKNAILSYYNASPGNLKQYPPNLEVLLQDPRFPNVRRHLRKIPLDPMTNSYEWGMKKMESGEILGVFSTSDKTPIKTANFGPGEADFAGAGTYQGWEFIAVLNNEQNTGTGNTAGGTTGAAGQPGSPGGAAASPGASPAPSPSSGSPGSGAPNSQTGGVNR